MQTPTKNAFAYYNVLRNIAVHIRQSIIIMSSWLHNPAEDSSRQAHWNLEGGMLRPSSNHETLWLLNDDYDDGCMNPPNVSTCSGQRLLTKDSNVKLNKMQNVLS